MVGGGGGGGGWDFSPPPEVGWEPLHDTPVLSPATNPIMVLYVSILDLAAANTGVATVMLSPPLRSTSTVPLREVKWDLAPLKSQYFPRGRTYTGRQGGCFASTGGPAIYTGGSGPRVPLGKVPSPTGCARVASTILEPPLYPSCPP